MLTFILLLLCFGLLAGPALAASPASAPPSARAVGPGIIDLHVHVAGTGAGGSGCYVSPQLRRNWRYGIYLKAFGVTRADLEGEGDALVFRRIAEELQRSKTVAAAVILALDGVVNEKGELLLEQTEIYIPNEFVAQQTAHYPNLLFGASVHPNRLDALQRLEEAAQNGAVLVKWLPAIQDIDPADQRHIPFYLKMQELGLPLLVHTGDEHSFTRVRHDVADPRKLHLPLSLGLTVIAAHAASTGQSEGQDNMERLLTMLPLYPNLYADISSLTQLNKRSYLPKLLQHTQSHERLVYGTDFPLINTALVSPWYFPFRLSWRQMRAIARETNPWDRDVLLKQALGVPAGVFTRGEALLRQPGALLAEWPEAQVSN